MWKRFASSRFWMVGCWHSPAPAYHCMTTSWPAAATPMRAREPNIPPKILRQMPFLLQPPQFTWACDQLTVCWIAHSRPMDWCMSLDNKQLMSLLYKGPFIATQLNSTSSGVELHRRSVCIDATQLDVELSTSSQREQLSAISSERRDPVRVSIATQLNSTRHWVELSRVAINWP